VGLIEIHTATLVHDDVVDDSNRRRFFSSMRFGKIKLQYLLVTIVIKRLLSIDNGDFDLLKIISIAVREREKVNYYR
jgi:octaprenyl-diphosphate synthase